MSNDLPAGLPPDEGLCSGLTNPGAGERLQQDDAFCGWLDAVSGLVASEFRKLFGADRRLAPHLVRPRTDPERWKTDVARMIETATLRTLSRAMPADLKDCPWVVVMGIHTAEVLKSLLGDDGAIHADLQPPLDFKDDESEWAESLESGIATALYLALRDSLVIQPAVTQTRKRVVYCFNVHYSHLRGENLEDS